MSVVQFPKGYGTVERLLEQMLENSEDIDKIVIVLEKKNGKITTAWSKQKISDLAWASKVLDWEVTKQMEDVSE